MYANKINTDIPNQHWLTNKVNAIITRGRDKYGVPDMSSVTAWFHDSQPVLVPVAQLITVKGQRDEQNKVRPESIVWLLEQMQAGSLPEARSGREDAPYIEIGYDGVPWVSEGNHRIMVADLLGWKFMPVEIKWFDGGNCAAQTIWTPEYLLEQSAKLQFAAEVKGNNYKVRQPIVDNIENGEDFGFSMS